MRFEKFFIYSILLFLSFSSCSMGKWNGKRAAIVLTYDDGYKEQLENALPLLDSLGLKASFYLSADFPAVKNRTEAWKQAAANGHELGNHTIYHPCIGNIPGREWVAPEQDLSKYSIERIQEEIRATNIFLEKLDGKKERTFAYTCGDTAINGEPFFAPLEKEFVAARGVEAKLNFLENAPTNNLYCFVVNNHSFEEMKKWVDDAIAQEGLVVFLFHGVGGGNPLDVTLDEHRRLLHYIAQKKKELWVAPLIEVASFIKANQ